MADLTLRPVTADDVAAVVGVHLASREAAEMPPGVHPEHEVRAWLTERQALDEMWLAEADGDVAAYVRMTPTWLDDLYVAPEHAGRGLGSALLDLVKARRPDGFCLWVFEMNTPARGFYAGHGLVELERTDGSGNEERSPDLRMAWPGRDPRAYLRRQVDEVDADLAQLLARRTALAAAIQRFKAVPGHAGRDPDREAEIVRRMAEHAPDLDERTLSRIMHEVIMAGLDLADRIGRE